MENFSKIDKRGEDDYSVLERMLLLVTRTDFVIQ